MQSSRRACLSSSVPWTASPWHVSTLIPIACAQARVAHTQLAGYVARRLRDPQASAAASDLGLLAAVLGGYARARHDCAATRDLLTAVSTEVRRAQTILGLHEISYALHAMCSGRAIHIRRQGIPFQRHTLDMNMLQSTHKSTGSAVCLLCKSPLAAQFEHQEGCPA